MIVQVVPVLRLRRNTTWWSYTLPRGERCQEGSLVAVPFRGATHLGVVWGVEPEQTHDYPLQEVIAILTRLPLVRAPQRRFIEWLAEAGLCSLSTALHQWLPEELRRFPPRKGVAAALAPFREPQTDGTPDAQHLILVPGKRPNVRQRLAEKYGSRFTSLFADDPGSFSNWIAVAIGECTIGLGRERALFAPWANLRVVTVSEPEDVSYYHEQIPYLSLVEAASVFGRTANATVTFRSALPGNCIEALWGTPSQRDISHQHPEIELIDLRRATLLNDRLVTAVRTSLTSGQHVAILLNAHDHEQIIDRDGQRERVVVPGVETVRKRLVAKLGYAELPDNLHVGTRSLLVDIPPIVGLSVALNLDALLEQTVYANRVHGWSDLCRLRTLAPRCLIQTHHPEDPLVQAFVGGSSPVGESERDQFTRYICAQTARQQTNGLPPFAEQLLCSYPGESDDTKGILEVQAELSKITTAPWQVSAPFASPWRKRPYTHLLLHAPRGSRVPVAIRTALAALPAPWRVQRNPWYVV